MSNKPRKRIGRPTKTPRAGERVSLGLRVTAKIKRRLDKAAERSGRSQSQEAELRLEQSFAREDEFGGPEIMNMARLMAAAFLRGGQLGARASGHPDWPVAKWIDDPVAFLVAYHFVLDTLQAAHPDRAQDVHPDPNQEALMP